MASRLTQAMMQQASSDRQPMPPLGETIYGMTPEGRPAYLDRDGMLSTERTVGVQEPRINAGQQTHIPSVFNGMELSPEQAAEIVATLGAVQAAKPEAGMVVDPVTGRRLLPNGDPAARSGSIQVEPNKAYLPLDVLRSQLRGNY